MGDITKDFSRKEFACHCGCGKDDICQTLVEILQTIRNEIEIPIIIHSGVRCEKYNAEVGGEKKSAHIRGRAVDIKCLDSRTRYNLIWKLINRFDRIGIGKDFIHVDIDYTLPRQMIWIY